MASPSANSERTDSVLTDVTCVSASDCWAVGSFWAGNSLHTLIEHWDGASWSKADSPNADPAANNSLAAVTCVTSANCWAVGSYFSGAVSKTLIERWDGEAWTVVASPNASPREQDTLTSVSCVSASDCWAVGSFYDNVAGAGGVGDADRWDTLFERWDGTNWIVVAAPNSTEGNNYLVSVTCAAATDCWAVGYYSSPLNYQTLITRWDGTRWTIAVSPNATVAASPFRSPTTNNYLTGVTCVSAADCWAVGHYFADSAEQTLIERWDGSSWTIAASPNTASTKKNVLSGVTCASASDCWAVGYYFSRNYFGEILQTLVQRWDGAAWAIVASPNTTADKKNVLASVTCRSASDCWAVGSYYTSDNFDQTLVERWNGSTWTVVPSPSVRSVPTDNFLIDAACVSASDCWAVGHFVNGRVYQTLLEHWDGREWTIAAAPDAGTAASFLRGVSCVSTADCWAVGSAGTKALIERWDGSSWTVAASPSISAALNGVTCVSAASCWAVGSAGGKALIERWDGTSWTVAASPDITAALKGVSCVSAVDCWAVGSAGTRTLIERWDGTSWTVVTSPNASSTSPNVLADVRCLSSVNCWAVGNYQADTSVQQTLIVRWDGASWATVASPNAGGTAASNLLLGLACATAVDCLAAGQFTGASGVAQTLIVRWDGASWVVATSPNTSATQGNGLYSATCSSEANCWAVGYGIRGGRLQTLTATRYSDAMEPPPVVPEVRFPALLLGAAILIAAAVLTRRARLAHCRAA